jgi:hypothetical protein
MAKIIFNFYFFLNFYIRISFSEELYFRNRIPFLKKNKKELFLEIKRNEIA